MYVVCVANKVAKIHNTQKCPVTTSSHAMTLTSGEMGHLHTARDSKQNSKNNVFFSCILTGFSETDLFHLTSKKSDQFVQTVNIQCYSTCTKIPSLRVIEERSIKSKPTWTFAFWGKKWSKVSRLYSDTDWPICNVWRYNCFLLHWDIFQQMQKWL